METSYYNGWQNYETWMVNLHICNDEVLYREAVSLAACTHAKAAQAYANIKNMARMPVHETGEAVKEFITSSIYDELSESKSPFRALILDCVTAALDEVYWYEIAEALLGGE